MVRVAENLQSHGISKSKKAADILPPLNRDLLKIYTYYRVILSCILLSLGAWGNTQHIVGRDDPRFFFQVSAIYAIINLVNLLLLRRSKFSPSFEQTFVVIVIDILTLTFLMHSSGGIASGLGVLIIISVAAGSIFLTGQIATLLAAIASTAILAESFYTSYIWGGNLRGIFPSGVLGALLFATALIFQNLSTNIRKTTLIAKQQTQQAESLEQLNYSIVQRMRTGIIVVSRDNDIRLMNESASRLLQMPVETVIHDKNHRLELPQAIVNVLHQWRQDQFTKIAPIRMENTAPEFIVNFSPIDSGETDDTLIFLDETSQITQHAQQLKLASLGRLTASIAHEIRNPLGAISHAAQLMRESETLDEGDRRLTNIVQSHCVRMNQVVENVLQLSRRTPARPQKILLQKWLNQFVDDYIAARSDKPEIKLEFSDEPMSVTIDPSQLSQVLTNLVDNGLRYSKLNTGTASLILSGRVSEEDNHTTLDIIDEGLGISEEAKANIFEPFYTTEKTGTGLGLYICRELCEANQARLGYTLSSEGKSCFRINFPHPERTII